MHTHPNTFLALASCWVFQTHTCFAQIRLLFCVNENVVKQGVVNGDDFLSIGT